MTHFVPTLDEPPTSLRNLGQFTNDLGIQKGVEIDGEDAYLASSRSANNLDMVWQVKHDPGEQPHAFLMFDV